MDPEVSTTAAIPVVLDVILDGGWRLAVRAQDPLHAEEVRLEPLSGVPLMPGGAPTCAATLEWRSEEGLVRREGTLSRDGDALVLVVDRGGLVMGRRAYERVRVAVAVHVLDDDGTDARIHTVDLSLGGMLLDQAYDLEIGERLEFALQLPRGAKILGRGRVVRGTEFGHRAVEFDAIEPDHKQRLREFLEDEAMSR
jgi:hypothetical protein